MYEIDRIAIVIKPNQPFIDWINSQENEHSEDKQQPPVSLEELQQDCTVLLIPPFEDEAEAEEYLESIYQDIFEHELSSWYLDETMWPNKRSYDMFRQWFSIEYHSLVYDLLDIDTEEEQYVTTTIQ